MYIGQIGINPWLKTSWLNSVGFNQVSKNISNIIPKEQTYQQTKSVNTDRLELSSDYLCFPNRMKILETPEAAQVNAILTQTEELRPASEKEYTEEDALMNQYMKQYRLNFIKEGDSYVLDKSKPAKLMIEGQVSQESLDAFREELEANGLGNDIDWRGVQEDFASMDIRFDNAENFEMKADYLASRYAVLKDRIQTQYTGENLEREMQKLNSLYTKAKDDMADSYAENIGGFYEEMGQSGVAEEMRQSVLATIDSKANEYSKFLEENDIYADITESSKQWLKQDDGYMAAKLRESVAASSVGMTDNNYNNEVAYSTEDLAFAALTAKTLSGQIKNPEWDVKEPTDSDTDLGKYLAQQYQSLTDMMQKAGISNSMSQVIKDSFEPFIDKLLDTLDDKIDYNRKRVAEKSWLSGFLRTNYINRNEVYKAFEIFK